MTMTDRLLLRDRRLQDPGEVFSEDAVCRVDKVSSWSLLAKARARPGQRRGRH